MARPAGTPKPSLPVLQGALAVLIGAGWGCAVGLPAANALISYPVLVPNEAAGRRARQVKAAFDVWSRANPHGQSEQFLTAVADGRVEHAPTEDPQGSFDLDGGGRALSWGDAVEFVQMRLATCGAPDAESLADDIVVTEAASALRYGDTLSKRSPHEKHLAFWEALGRTSDFRGVVTTNYDLTIERSLRDSTTHTACHYGGLAHPQSAIGPSRSGGRRGAPTFVLRGTVPLCKLHGSLNWFVAPSGVQIYQDTRPAYAHRGTAAIVAPIEEKKPEPWLVPVWTAAKAILATAETWLVVGYRLPEYDRAIRAALAEAATGRPRIVVMDPDANVHDVWRAAFPECRVEGWGAL